jgi:hypothetical protein
MPSNNPTPQATMARAKEAEPMGATVLGCGSARHLFKMEYFVDAPQVHLHFLTDDIEFKENGFGRLELVCHGCGASLLLLYDQQGNKRRYLDVRNSFFHKHKGCTNRGYHAKCPNYRSSCEVLDKRTTKPKQPRRQRQRTV